MKKNERDSRPAGIKGNEKSESISGFDLKYGGNHDGRNVLRHLFLHLLISLTIDSIPGRVTMTDNRLL